MKLPFTKKTRIKVAWLILIVWGLSNLTYSYIDYKKHKVNVNYMIENYMNEKELNVLKEVSNIVENFINNNKLGVKNYDELYLIFYNYINKKMTMIDLDKNLRKIDKSINNEVIKSLILDLDKVKLNDDMRRNLTNEIVSKINKREKQEVPLIIDDYFRFQVR